jgi:hypothetical protein
VAPEVRPLGSSFTYQGRLTDGGNPVDGTCDFTFKLYDEAGTGSPPSGGNLVGTEVKKGVEVEQGLFTVDLDFTEGAFNGQARWLEIAVDCGAGPTTLSSRQAVTAAPYAHYALRAPWSGLVGIPAGLGDGDDDTLSALDCKHGQIAKWDEDSQSWECSRDRTDGGDYWSLEGNAGTTPPSNFLGTTDAVSLTLKVNDTVALRIEPTLGTPNFIGGYAGNRVVPGVVGATIGGGGKSAGVNRVVDEGGTVGGGAMNVAGEEDGDTALSVYATVAGGCNNTAGGWGATVGGGNDNTANGGNATVSGGNGNTASEGASSVGGGEGNAASALAATVCGGWYSTAGEPYTTVGGGQSNTAGGEHATVSGGFENTASGQAATVGGGLENVAEGLMSTIAGGEGNSAVTPNATIGGGADNIASGNYATIAGGEVNKAEADDSTIGGGAANTISGRFATVPGGRSAEASHWGEMAYASGQFQERGDAQTSTYVVRTATADDTPTELYLDGVSRQITVADGRTVTFDILVGARSDKGDSAGYSMQGLIESAGSSTAFVGTPTVVVLGEDVTAWDASVEADSTDHALVVKVTGAKDTNIRWVATVRTAEVAWPVP